ncbi:cysteine desulfurase family protein [uncultured Flavobacterium sp.]|uniref:cysteine desulfurase family protein n=1 Tax=uncultured Flavobacterium sp. TaxID=165435 RepID=UPI0025D5D00E|nr:cysteine desulfurase family protein [uncultured Flavobacterium sp.]
MNKAYLDNASTTAMHPEVIAEMVRVMAENYGNPSSTHATGRNAKNVLETARKTIAALVGAEAREIIFTSCGTEANNWIIRSAAKDLKVQRIISSRAEHHSVLNTVQAVGAEYGITVDYVNLLPNGAADLTHLVKLLSDNVPTLVSLMHVNNETGGILDIERAGRICKQAGALFHTDAVQSVGKVKIDLKDLSVDFLTASAHKFHGPKGAGFAFVRKNTALQPIIFGGEQEKGFRAGTEAIHQVAGMAKALQLSCQHLEAGREHVTSLKQYLLKLLEVNFPGYKVNGLSANSELFYNIANILMPFTADKTSMILFHLDMKGVAVSRGSACQSGSIKPSHVLKELLPAEDVERPSLRISLSHTSTREDIEQLIDALKSV